MNLNTSIAMLHKRWKDVITCDVYNFRHFVLNYGVDVLQQSSSQPHLLAGRYDEELGNPGARFVGIREILVDGAETNGRDNDLVGVRHMFLKTESNSLECSFPAESSY